MIISKLLITNKNIKLIDISFELKSTLAIVGKSGSGKSLTIKAILDMVPQNLKVIFRADRQFSKQNIGFVPQNPFTSFSPMTKIKDHFEVDYVNMIKCLELVGLSKEILDRYSIELSGGQLQRVIIAIALSINPTILLLDEPTTALDFDTKKEFLSLLKSLIKQMKNLKIIFVTHDIDSIKDICNDIIILKDGKIVESGETSKILQNPQTDYTKELLLSTFTNRSFRQ